ncbi:MAG: neutral/alkaline non-lysosomal ceramidase N-terminal domain-containing protein [Thermoguttaceae bacterium]
MTLAAGTAVGEITPRLPAALFGYPHVERIASGIHDPLLASALYLKNPSGAVVLIALDLLLLEPPVARSIRRAVAQRLAIGEQCVLISCTHTHSGPVTAQLLAWSDDRTIPPPDAEYLRFLSDKVVETARLAAARATPAEIAWTAADARGVGGNRHTAEGVTDPEVGILAVRRAGGGPLLATALVYGMHPTVLHEDSALVSADFPHYARQHLRERFGEQLSVLYQMGLSGNQSPRFFVRGQTFAEAERLGRQLGQAVVASLERLAAADFDRECELRAVLRPVDLPPRPMPPVADAQAILAQCRAAYHRLQQQRATQPEVRTAECAVFGAEGTLTLARLNAGGAIGQALGDRRPIEVQAVRIGDGYLAGLPGELFAEYALEIKRRFADRVFVVSLVNGDLQGYIVTPQAAAEGCYESLTALFQPEAGTQLVSAALEALGELAAS